MSYTVNGIGTQIYGRDKELTREDQCDQCGSFTKLASYDATNYFVVLFLPIIPMGKLRVLDHCTQCQRWRQLPLKKWESTKEDAIRQSLEAMRANPSDSEAMQQALATATRFQDQGVLLQFKQVAENFRSDADVQSLLGATLSYFGRNEEAITAYETSLAAKDDIDIREQLGLEYASIAQPEKAEPYLAHIWTPEKSDKVPFAIALVNGYHATGDHRTAIQTLDKIATTYPGIGGEQEFQKIYKKAEKYERKGKPVPQLVGSGSTYKEKSSSTSAAKWFFPLALAAGFLLFMVCSFFAGANRKIALVNGLNEPYTATVADEEYTLQPMEMQRVSVGEGDIPVSATINGIELPQETHSIKTPLFSRLFSNPLFVINPDKAAVLSKQKVTYSEHGDLGEPDYEYFAGESFYQFEDIDFQFIDPPLEMDLGSLPMVTKDLVDFAPVQETEMATLTQYNLMLEPEQITAYLRQQVRFGNASEISIGMLMDLDDTEEVIELLQPHLNETPTNLAVHRAYQQSTETASPETDLIAEYKARLEQDPTNADLMYLVARISPKKERREYLSQAIKATPPSAYAFNSLAFEALHAGKFKAGIPFARRANKMEPNPSFQVVLAQLLEASGQHEEALELMDDSLHGDSFLAKLQRLQSEIPILAGGGKIQQIKQKIDEVLEPVAGSDFHDALTVALRGQCAYSLGNVDVLSSLVEEAEQKPFYMLVALNRLEEAAERLNENESVAEDTSSLLTMYVAAMNASKEEFAEPFLKKAIEILSKGDKDDRAIAKMLDQYGESDPEVVDEAIMWPMDKRIYLAALAFRHPEDFNHYLGLAKKLNYNRSSPYLLIKQLKPR